MEIKKESQLVEELAKKLRDAFNTDIAITELSAGYGIVDLAFAKNFFTTKNRVNRYPINNYLSIKLLLSLSSKAVFCVKDAMRITGTSEQVSRKMVLSLLSLGYIEKVEKNKYRKTYDINNPIKKIVAIEAKLKDWKQGMLQARRYKSFTDECYLAILSKYEKNIDYNYIEKFGIGLILFNPEDGSIIFKRKPKKNVFLSFYDESLSVFAKEMFLYQSISSSKTA